MFMILSGVGLSALVAWAVPPKTTLPSPPHPGRFTLVIKSGGYDRVAHIQIPKTYKVEAKSPLVLLLHGGGGSGTHALERDGWADKAEKEGFLVVAPDGLGAAPKLPTNFRLNPAVWNAANLRRGSRRAAIDDVAFFRQLLDDLTDKLPYDRNRVYCVGHSNGGGMTFKAAAEISERFTAIGTVAGLIAVENPKPRKALPTLYIIGTKDPLMPVEGGEVKTPWGIRQNPPISEPLAKWATALGCETEPKVMSDKDGLKKVEYPSRSDGPTLTVLYIEGHGHHWPGAQSVLPRNLMGPNTSKLNATDAIWEFFRSVPAAKKSSAPIP
jgi:polyhydroxybutyrate depolymerase